MRSHLQWSALVLAAVQLTACGGTNPPVTVVGPEADVRALSGNWFGEYASPLTGRSGTIVFALEAGADSAWGRVVMTPSGAAGPVRPWQNPRGAVAMPRPTELSIRFVHIAGGRVSGSLTPYADPATGEPRYTVFEGRMVADTIAGTYTSRPSVGDPPTGRWRVVRDRP